ncbi:MAG: dephospho-CoA kinase [Dehalococcoidia bacterium]|nr:dephospho-CoA kinase [Dehalococcoidia bacterium]
MFVIGITGLLGSGKSTVAGFLRELGVPVIDADRVGHQVYMPGTVGHKALVTAFGRHILAGDGTVDRKILGNIVFSDASSLEKLNAIVHPLILDEVSRQLGELNERATATAAVEAALLVQAGWRPMVDELWVTTAPREIIYARMAAKWNWTTEQVDARLATQDSPKEQTKYATCVIDTNVPLHELKARVETLWREIQSKLPS